MKTPTNSRWCRTPYCSVAPTLSIATGSGRSALELARSGAKLSAFPTGFHQGLYKKLGGAPSSGIAFCALVKQERGALLRSSCFGFAFVDQIGAKRTSAHYFRDARPSFTHQWKREKEMFDELTASSPGRRRRNRCRLDEARIFSRCSLRRVAGACQPPDDFCAQVPRIGDAKVSTSKFGRGKVDRS